MATIISQTPIAAPDVADSTWVKIRSRDDNLRYRRVENYTGGDIYIQVQDSQPSGITGASRVKDEGNWETNVLSLCTQDIWCYHELGVLVQSSSATALADKRILIVEG